MNKLPDQETIKLMIDVAELASLKTRIEDDKLSPFISFREAARKYGAGVVKAWKEAGLIKFIQDDQGKKIRIDRLKIEAVSKASNRGL